MPLRGWWCWGPPDPLGEEGGGRAEGGTGAGSWSWREPAEPHVLRNGGTTRLIIYEIDWR